MSNLSENFLSEYDINQYDRPSVAADIAVFTVMSGDTNHEYRKLPQKKLKLLLVRRAEEPFKNLWALPGGFLRKGETIYQAAKRELKEETGTERAHLEMCCTFSEQNRDPRGWIISQAFMALMNSEDHNLMNNLHAGGDADEVAWFDVMLKKLSENRERHDDDINSKIVYELILSGIAELTATIEESKIYKDYHENISYCILNSDGLAFDHAKIITCILNKVRQNIQIDTRIAFDLMPTYFSLTDLQSVFEVILDKKLLKPNFRRKISEYVEETDNIVVDGGHRPSKLFRRNMNAFYG